MGGAVPAIAANVDSARAAGHAIAAENRATEAAIDSATGNPIGAALNERSAIAHSGAANIAAARSGVEATLANGLGGSGVAALGAHAAANAATRATLGAVGAAAAAPLHPAAPIGSGLGYPGYGVPGYGYPGMGLGAGYPYGAGYGYPYGAYGPYGYGAGMNRALATGAAAATGAALANSMAGSALASSAVGVGPALGVSY